MQQISLSDWQRVVIGDAPWIFLVELLVRSLVVYLLLLFFMRLMGRRVAAQMSATELAVILMIGAAIGLPIQVPDKGLLPGVVVLAVVLICHRSLSYLTFRSHKIELLTHGAVIILAKDGRVLTDELRKVYFSSDKLFALLRTQSVEHLGQVRRVYLEAWGDLSVIRYCRPKPGLLILPPMELPTGRYTTVEGQMACGNCGTVILAEDLPANCGICGEGPWQKAVIEADSGKG